jgi:folate-binding protein YgfZ
MNEQLTAAWRRRGATLDVDTARPLHFGAPADELRASLERSVLADGSQLARLAASGPDYLGLLHRLSTGDVATLEPGQGRITILTTPKGRIVERLFVHPLGPSGVLSVGGAGRGASVLEHLARFTFAENTGLTDRTTETFQFLLVGPQAATALDATGLERPGPLMTTTATVGHTEVQVLGQDGLCAEGFSIVGPSGSAAEVWDSLLDAVEGCGGRAAGDGPLEARRVLRGLPASGHELTGDYNPLEAGQWDAVSFDKGCYVGQEVVARLNTYDKVSRSLVGLMLPAGSDLPEVGAPLYFDEREVGVLTSAVVPPGWSHPVGIAYLKRKVAEPGIELAIGSADATTRGRMVRLPFSVTRSS